MQATYQVDIGPWRSIVSANTIMEAIEVAVVSMKKQKRPTDVGKIKAIKIIDEEPLYAPTS